MPWQLERSHVRFDVFFCASRKMILLRSNTKASYVLNMSCVALKAVLLSRCRPRWGMWQKSPFLAASLKAALHTRYLKTGEYAFVDIVSCCACAFVYNVSCCFCVYSQLLRVRFCVYVSCCDYALNYIVRCCAFAFV
jgi:hypothetical protein